MIKFKDTNDLIPSKKQKESNRDLQNITTGYF